jgi:hypothetical protein
MNKKGLLTALALSVIVIGSLWYFYIFRKPVETINSLIGKDYDYACNIYFKKSPDVSYNININHNLSEFDGAILNSKNLLTDSIVNVYTWTYSNHKKTIWVGQTSKMKNQIIDAIRYKNNVRF